MTTPEGEGITTDTRPITLPAWYVTGNDESIPGLTSRSQDIVSATLQTFVKDSPNFQASSAALWEGLGLRPGIPLPAAILEWIMNALGLGEVYTSMGAMYSDLNDWVATLPTLEGLITALTGGLTTGDWSDLEDWANQLLDAFSPVNALNLFNLVPTDLMGHVSASAIGTAQTNLITDPDFLDPTPIDDWLHNPTGGYGGTGSRTVTADGTTKELLGNLIGVSEDQVVSLSGRARWAGLTGTGNPVALGVTGYTATGDATVQAIIDSHNTIPTTTDWIALAGNYPVPANVAGIRTRLIVDSTATAGTVSFSTMKATKVGPMLQRLIAGTDLGNFLPDDIANLFTGIISNTLEILNKAALGDFNDLVSTIAGDLGDTIDAVADRVATWLDSFSPLNGSNIASGNIADEFIGGIATMLNNIVTGLLGVGGTGFNHDDAAGAFQSNKHALVDHGAGITQMYARMSSLESQFAALPVSAGGTGSGNADGGLIGAIDTDTFERVNTASISPLWLSTQVGAGKWAIPNGHDATFSASGFADTEFLCIRDNPVVPRSQTNYQRVTMELSSAAARYYDPLLGLYNYAGGNDIWLRISDDTTSLTNVTGIRIRWEADGGLSIVRFVSGAPTLLKGLGTGGIVAPGPGANLIGEAGDLANGAARYFKAKIGESIRLEIQEVGTASGLGSGFRRWGHGGRAEAAGILVGQAIPGGVHFWNGMDQTTS